MVRAALLIVAAVALVLAVGLALVPFDARLATRARDGTPMERTVGLECRAPLLDGLGVADGDDRMAPQPCDTRARARLGLAAVAAVVGTGLLVGGLRVPLRGAAVPVDADRSRPPG